MDLSDEELQKMEQEEIRRAAAEELTDIREIPIDRKKPVSARIEDYVRKVGNPFLVRVGEYAVKIGYSEDAGSLDDRMKQYIRKVGGDDW